MLRWPHLVVGFALFSGVTLYVATLGLTPRTLQSLWYAAVLAYVLGTVGMAVALTKVGAFWRTVAVLVFGAGTGGLSVALVASRFSMSVNLPAWL